MEKVHNCHECGNKLTQYEISDNLCVGVKEIDYICYSCQSEDLLGEDDFDEYEDLDNNLY